MKKWIGIILMAATLSQTTSFSKEYANIIVKKGSSFPITQLTLFVPVGSASLDKQGGESALLQSLISYSSLGHIIENHGGDYSLHFTKDSSSFQISLLTEELPLFLSEFSEEMKGFQIQNQDLLLAKKRLIEQIHNIDGNPERKSSLLFQEKIFGTHPYANNPMGTLETVSKISVEDLTTTWQMLFGEKNSLYVIASSDTPDEIQKLLQNFWASFPQTSFPKPNLAPVTIPDKPMIWAQKDLNSSQSFVNMGILIPHVQLSEKPFLLILADIIGGGFNSRLFTILRAKNGLSYSPHAYYKPQLQADVLAITYSTKSSNTSQSISIVQDILEDLKKNGITQKELDTTKKLIYNRLLRLEENNQSLNQLVANDILYQNPEDSIKILEQGIRDCTLENINHYVKSLFDKYPQLRVVLEGS